MDKESAHSRLLQAIEYLKDNGLARKHEEIADLTGISRPNVSAAIRGNARYITEGNLKRFARAYSDFINENWLLTGEGEMRVPDKLLKPHFDAVARAGFMGDYNEGESGRLTGLESFMPQYDFTIMAQGDSMNPEIHSGDILLCRILLDRQNVPVGKICVIDSSDGALVKEISETSEECVTLHSLNPAYQDVKVKLDDINGLAVVAAILRKQ